MKDLALGSFLSFDIKLGDAISSWLLLARLSVSSKMEPNLSLIKYREVRISATGLVKAGVGL